MLQRCCKAIPRGLKGLDGKILHDTQGEKLEPSHMTTRKSLAAMTAADHNRYKTTINTLISRPDNFYGKMVGVHGNMMHQMHGGMGAGTQRFLSWHRDYLLKLEQAMQAIDPQCFIPYWDWTKKWALPAWMKSFKPTVFVPGRGTIVVTRKPDATAPASASAAQIAALQNIPDYTTFTDTLENNAHGAVHMAMNGTMSDIRIAPADPVFWMHHAQIDRIWSQWQAKHPGKNPTLSGTHAIMDPWTETATQLRSIATLGYVYS